MIWDTASLVTERVQGASIHLQELTEQKARSREAGADAGICS